MQSNLNKTNKKTSYADAMSQIRNKISQMTARRRRQMRAGGVVTSSKRHQLTRSSGAFVGDTRSGFAVIFLHLRGQSAEGRARPSPRSLEAVRAAGASQPGSGSVRLLRPSRWSQQVPFVRMIGWSRPCWRRAASTELLLR